MDRFMEHTTGCICIFSFLWNAAYSSDFEESRKKIREEMESFDRSFTVARVVVPIVMVLMFLGSCVIFWCIWYHRRQRFFAMQEQQRHVPPRLAPAPGPGPVTSGATSFGHSEVNPLISRAVTPPPAPYPPQPAMSYPTEGPYSNFNCAPSAQPCSGTAMPSAPPEPPPPYNTYSSETKPPL
uniref:Putative secreted peptide n=1 Tax=Amblyomma aureolatum TaxID=187763 RepID=A0A1E1X205_9ACAR